MAQVAMTSTIEQEQSLQAPANYRVRANHSTGSVIVQGIRPKSESMSVFPANASPLSLTPTRPGPPSRPVGGPPVGMRPAEVPSKPTSRPPTLTSPLTPDVVKVGSIDGVTRSPHPDPKAPSNTATRPSTSYHFTDESAERDMNSTSNTKEGREPVLVLPSEWSVYSTSSERLMEPSIGVKRETPRDRPQEVPQEKFYEKSQEKQQAINLAQSFQTRVRPDESNDNHRPHSSYADIQGAGTPTRNDNRGRGPVLPPPSSRPISSLSATTLTSKRASTLKSSGIIRSRSPFPGRKGEGEGEKEESEPIHPEAAIGTAQVLDAVLSLQEGCGEGTLRNDPMSLHINQNNLRMAENALGELIAFVFSFVFSCSFLFFSFLFFSFFSSLLFSFLFFSFLFFSFLLFSFPLTLNVIIYEIFIYTHHTVIPSLIPSQTREVFLILHVSFSSHTHR
jgi:hypothetical protein